MAIIDELEKLRTLSRKDKKLAKELIDTKDKTDPLKEFCDIALANECEIYPMELVLAGEEFYAEIKRSTNGGGENSPMLDGQDDLYEMFLAELKQNQ